MNAERRLRQIADLLSRAGPPDHEDRAFLRGFGKVLDIDRARTDNICDETRTPVPCPPPADAAQLLQDVTSLMQTSGRIGPRSRRVLA